MSQIALPLTAAPGARADRIVLGNANSAAIEAMTRSAGWPFRTAVLAGEPRSGKSLIARWFAESGHGEAIDNADSMDEAALFHHWNRSQELGSALLLVSNRGSAGWQVALPDLASRLGAALHLEISAPDDAMLGELIAIHAEQRGFALDATAAAYLVPRTVRSHMGVEALVTAIDRLSLERKQPPTLAIWRDALEAVQGAEQPRLL